MGPCAVQNPIEVPKSKVSATLSFQGSAWKKRCLTPQSAVIESLVAGKASYANEASSFFCSLSSLSFQSTKEEEKGKNSGEGKKKELPSSRYM